MSEVLGWWFGPADLRLPHGDGRTVVVGEKLTVDPPIVPCQCGLHASVNPLAALAYAPNKPAICRVRLTGEIVQDGDKHAASERTTLAIVPADEAAILLRRFACWCVRHTPLHDGRMVWELLTDERSRHAVEVAEQYCDGLATDEELNAAGAAAGDAAWDAAGAAAGAAAGDAAWAAAWEATAGDAAWAAARAAAGAAARAAAGAAAWAAAWDVQNIELERVLMAVIEGKGQGDE